MAANQGEFRSRELNIRAGDFRGTSASVGRRGNKSGLFSPEGLDIA